MKYYFINIRNKTEFMNIAKNVVQRYLQEYYRISRNYMSLPDRIEQYGNKYSCRFKILSESKNLLLTCEYVEDNSYFTINSYSLDMSHKISLQDEAQKENDSFVKHAKQETIDRLTNQDSLGWTAQEISDAIDDTVAKYAKDFKKHNKDYGLDGDLKDS